MIRDWQTGQTTGQSGRWDLNPRHLAWKARALPLSYTRIDFELPIVMTIEVRNGDLLSITPIRIRNLQFQVGREGFEPPNSEGARFTVWCN